MKPLVNLLLVSLKMQLLNKKGYTQSGQIDMSHSDFEAACERGRKLAAEAVRVDRKARRRVEKAFGIAYCRDRYPEAYAK